MPQVTTTNIQGRLGREVIPAPRGAWRLLSFMVFVFAVFVLSYLGLVFGYQKFLEAQIADTTKKLADLASQIPKEQQDAYLKFQYQLVNLEKLLNNHVIISRLLPLLEANTNQSVSMTALEVNAADHRIDIQGVARSYDVFASQLEAFEELPSVLRYQIASTKLKEAGKVEFTVSVILNPSVFRSPQP